MAGVNTEIITCKVLSPNNFFDSKEKYFELLQFTERALTFTPA